MLDFSKLFWLKQGPHELTRELEKRFAEVYPKPFFFVFWTGKIEDWKSNMKNSQLRFIGVVRANSFLYSLKDTRQGYLVSVLIDDKRAMDHDWVKDKLELIKHRLYDNSFPEVTQLLQQEEDFFDVELPRSLADDTKMLLHRKWVRREELPNGCIPESNVLPALKHGEMFSLIPPSWYLAVNNGT